MRKSFSGGRCVAREPQFEVSPDVRPLRGENAVHHDITRGSIAPHAEVPYHAVFLRAQRLDGPLRAKVEGVGPEAHNLAPERVERVAEQEQLAGRVDVGPLTALRVPRV
jgi:hypothetical protein